MVVDEAYLEDIAANNNRRVDETGDAAAIVIGHTKDDEEVAEEDQPRVVGFATHFAVLPFFETDRKALACMMHIYRKDYDAGILDRFPRRSVELWTTKREIEPISLLGSSTPERALGLVLKFSRDSHSTSYRYLSEIAMPQKIQPTRVKYEAMDDKPKTDDDKAMDTAKENETSSVKKLEAEVAQLKEMLMALLAVIEGDGDEAGMDDGGDALPPAPMPPGEMEPEPPQDVLGPDDEKEKDKRSHADGNPVKFSSMPSQSNTYLPENKTKMSRQNDEVVKLQRQYAADRAKYERDLLELKLKLSRSEAEKIVADLVNEGYTIADEKEEVEILARLPDVHRTKHVERIKKSYQRAPIATNNNDVLKYARADQGAELTYEQALNAADLVSRGQYKSLEDAYQKLYGKSVK